MSLFEDHRDKIADMLREDNNEEAIEILDYVMERLNKVDTLVQEALSKLFEEISTAETTEQLEFLWGGINTCTSMGEAILEGTSHLGELHMLKFQEMMLKNPRALIDLLTERADMPEEEADKLTKLIRHAVDSKDDSDLEDAIQALKEVNDGFQEKRDKKNEEGEEKLGSDEFWNFSDLK